MQVTTRQNAAWAASGLEVMDKGEGITFGATAVDPRKLGLPITVLSQVVSKNGWCMPIREFARHQPGVTECCHITGEKDVLIKASFASVGAVEALVNRLTQYGNVTTSVVLSSWMGILPAE